MSDTSIIPVSRSESNPTPSRRGFGAERPDPFNAVDAARHLDLIWPPNGIIELRSIGCGPYKQHTVSGYCDNDDDALECVDELITVHEAPNVYVTINAPDPALRARRQNRVAICGKGDATTSDADIVALRHLFIDIDSIRRSGICATYAQHDEALALAEKIETDLTRLGWPAPLKGDSGNGGYLIYRVELEPSQSEVLKQCLQALDLRHTNKHAKIDTSTANPARICRVLGTWNRKGDDTPERPHRLSRIISAPEQLEPVPLGKLQALAATLPESDEPKRRPGRPPKGIDVGEWLEQFADELPEVGEPNSWQGGTKWQFSHCPFDPSHTGSCAVIIEMKSGAPCVKCQHDSCKKKGWTELKELVGDTSTTGSKRAVLEDDPNDPRATVVVSDREYATNDAALDALVKAELGIYQRGHELARIVHASACQGMDQIKRDPAAPLIVPVDRDYLQEILSKVCRFVCHNHKGELVLVHPPLWCPRALLARKNWEGVPALIGVTPYPILRPDWTIINEHGYDRATGLYSTMRGGLPDIPSAPTRDDAQAATMRLLDLLHDFPLEDCGKSVWLSVLLTVLTRFVHDGDVPLFCFDASRAGEGKTLLVKLIGMILAGVLPPMITYPGDTDPAEARKLLTSLLMQGDSLLVLDNLEVTLGDSELNRLITARFWTDRRLGSNQALTLPNNSVIIATANNPTIHRDTFRRLVSLRLATDLEAPETRRDFKHPDLLGYAREHHRELLRDALTILAAFNRAGRPEPETKLAPKGRV